MTDRIDELYGIAEDGYSRDEDNHGGIAALHELATIAMEAIAERDALQRQAIILADWHAERCVAIGSCDECSEWGECPISRRTLITKIRRPDWIDAAREATK